MTSPRNSESSSPRAWTLKCPREVLVRVDVDTTAQPDVLHNVSGEDAFLNSTETPRVLDLSGGKTWSYILNMDHLQEDGREGSGEEAEAFLLVKHMYQGRQISD